MPPKALMMGASCGVHDTPHVIFVLRKKTMHLIGKIIFVLGKNNMGASFRVLDTPHDAPITGSVGHPYDTPMLFFDSLVKKLDNLSTSNIDIYPSTLEICINNLLKLFFFGSGPPPPP